jgi:hypothetical protein
VSGDGKFTSLIMTLPLMAVFHAKQVALDFDEWMAAVD